MAWHFLILCKRRIRIAIQKFSFVFFVVVVPWSSFYLLSFKKDIDTYFIKWLPPVALSSNILSIAFHSIQIKSIQFHRAHITHTFGSLSLSIHVAQKIVAKLLSLGKIYRFGLNCDLFLSMESMHLLLFCTRCGCQRYWLDFFPISIRSFVRSLSLLRFYLY